MAHHGTGERANDYPIIALKEKSQFKLMNSLDFVAEGWVHVMRVRFVL